MLLPKSLEKEISTQTRRCLEFGPVASSSKVESKLLSALESLHQAITSQNFYPLPFTHFSRLQRRSSSFWRWRWRRFATRIPIICQDAQDGGLDQIVSVVTHLTIMSRAMQLGKPRVALRLCDNSTNSSSLPSASKSPLH